MLSLGNGGIQQSKKDNFLMQSSESSVLILYVVDDSCFDAISAALNFSVF